MTSPAQTITQRATRPLGGLHVLVVEDDGDALDLMRLMLEEAGAVVICAPSAQAALDVRDAVDVIVSDIGMPDMDGYGLMQRLRSRASTATLPAIAVSAYTSREHVERALAVGYDRHLGKPVELAQLIAAIRHVVHERIEGQ